MRQRLCSNSGHHRATIAALAIKSSRGTRSVYTDRFKYVALQSRMYKRWRWGVETRRFSSRRWKIERGQIWTKFARACSRAILDFGNSGKRGSSRLSIGFWWTDFFFVESIFDKYQNFIYIWKTRSTSILWIRWLSRVSGGMEEKSNF